MAAIEEAVPCDVLSASLYTRFRSRQDHTFAEKMLSGMRNKFGGHVERAGRRLICGQAFSPRAYLRNGEIARKSRKNCCTRNGIGRAPRRPLRDGHLWRVGDLTKRKLIPALYNLAKDNLLSKEFALVGFARERIDQRAVPRRDRQGNRRVRHHRIRPRSVALVLAANLLSFAGISTIPRLTRNLSELLEQIDKEHGTRGNYFYYLATSPGFFATDHQAVGRGRPGARKITGWRRVIIEKPFGRDYDSARALNKEIRKVLDEKQIYRIDHYLGKETVQNILVFRFSNGIFEPIWNRRYIDHVQITVAETVGVEQRGGYYEKAGTLRDMVPNHIFQLISLTAMEPPVSFDADVVRDEQAKILKAITPMTPEEVLTRTVRGQYGEGVVRRRKSVGLSVRAQCVAGFPHRNLRRDEALHRQLALGRRTLLFAHRQTLPKRVTEISIQFKRAPFVLFRKTAWKA